MKKRMKNGRIEIRDRKKKWFKRIGIGLACVAVLGSLMACSGKKEAGSENLSGAESGVSASSDGTQVMAMGRYVEKGFSLPEEANSYARSMSVLSDGRIAYFDGMNGLYLSEDEGQSWKSEYGMAELFEECGGESYIADAAVSREGRLAILTIDFPENGDPSAVVYIRDLQGNVSVHNAVPEAGLYVAELSWKEEELFGFTVRGGAFQFEQEAEELKKVFQAASSIEMITFLGEKMVLLEREAVEIYNLETRQQEPSDEVLSSFVREQIGALLASSSGSEGGILFPAGEDALYLACAQGLFRHVIGGAALEQVVDGRFSAMGDSTLGLCGMTSYGDGEFLLLTTGAQLIRMTYDPNEPSRPDQMLKVYSLYEMERIRQGISLFQKNNPDIWIDYQVGIPENSAVTLDDALKNLNLELTAGTGPDVLVLDGMNADTYIEKKALRGLGTVADSLVGENALLPNVLSAAAAGEEPFWIPAAFRVPVLIAKNEDLARITDMESLVRETERLSQTANRSVIGCFTPKRELQQLLSVYHESFLNGKELSREALEQFLEYALRIHHANQENITDVYRAMFADNDLPMDVGTLVQMQYGEISQLSFGLAKTMLFDVGAIGTLTEGGEYGVKLFDEENAGFVFSCQLAIPASSARQTLAETFLLTLLGAEAQKLESYDAFPVNQEAFAKLCNEEESEASFASGWSLPEGGELLFESAYPKRELTRQLEEMVSKLDRTMQRDARLQETIVEVGVEILEGKRTVEEGVNAIEKKMAIYLAE